MKLQVLSSSSKGNGYLITNGSEAIAIEAGVRLVELKKAINFKISKVKARLISHGHADHSGVMVGSEIIPFRNGNMEQNRRNRNNNNSSECSNICSE